MNKEQESFIQDTASAVVEDFIIRESNKSFHLIQGIIENTIHVNKDTKRIAVRNMNDWIDFLDSGETLPHYTINEDGRVVLHFETEEQDRPPNISLDSDT